MDRLADSGSRYLREQADSPVDWWPWSRAAQQEAARRGLPLLISIGYSACHWCHVMAREAFADPATARFVNGHFVAIKVDREEHPDVDATYLRAAERLNGRRGGWPLTVFADAEGSPFYIGNYYPAIGAPGDPSLLQVCRAVSDAWTEDRAGVARIIRSLPPASHPGGPVDIEPAAAGAADALAWQFDHRHGGFGIEPKFPRPAVLEFLLRRSARTGEPRWAHYAERTAQEMADGALHDQLGGGFHRYCADRAWAVPHFEKMLYDNAQLVRVYLHLWRQTGAVWARRVAERTCAWLLRDLLLPDGLFAASLSAEDGNGDGAFYRWTADELGDWAGVLGVTGPGATALRAPAVNDAAWHRERRRLYRVRRHRPAPDRDDKAVTEWNALAVSALAEAAVLLDRPDLLSAAEHTAGELLIRHRRGPRLLRTTDGGPAVLADYAALADALLLLHQATGVRCWLDEAGQLIARARDEFRGPAGEWFDSGAASAVPVRTADPADSGTAAGPAAVAATLWRHGRITDEPEHRREAVELVEMLLGAGLEPVDTGTALALAEAITAPRVEAHTPRDGPLQRLAWADPQPGVLALTGDTPLAAGMSAEHAYVCHDRLCSTPTTDPEHFAQLLKAS